MKILICFAISVAFISGCYSRTEADYMFTARGAVKDTAGKPIPGVVVTLSISDVVYKAITPKEKDVTQTDRGGEFSFDYISGEKDPPYDLLFEKEGYESVTIKQANQKMNPHKIVLKQKNGQ